MRKQKVAVAALLLICAGMLSGCSWILHGKDEALVGTWEATEGDVVYTFTSSTVTMTANGYTVKADYGVDTKRTPHAIDVKITRVSAGSSGFDFTNLYVLVGLSNLRILEGLYEVSGDDGEDLIMTLMPKSLGRPTSIPDSSDSDSQLLVTMTRVDR